jgi:hypothetical protein
MKNFKRSKPTWPLESIKGSLGVDVKYLQFQFSPGKSAFQSEFSLVNKSIVQVAYKIKTTSPLRFSVKPSQGNLDVNIQQKIHVTLNLASGENFLLMKDKFQIEFLGKNENELEQSGNKSFSSSQQSIKKITLPVVILDKSNIRINK